MISHPLFRTAVIGLVGLGVIGYSGARYFNSSSVETALPCPAVSAGKTAVRVSGLSWDADSNGFAFILGLSAEAGAAKAGRLNSRIYVVGQPDSFAVTETGPEFQIEFETDQPTFRLIAEGTGFPRTISQPYDVPKEGCDIDIERLLAPRAEGPEHTWPLPIVATEMGYQSWTELMDDNHAVIRLLAYGSGEEGTPDLADNSLVEAEGTKIEVYPFDMDKEITFLQMQDTRIGAFIIAIPFDPDEPADKEFSLKIVDTVTQPDWNPPRPWKYDPVTVFVRNGFASDIRIPPSLDQ
jgi:hypothetical protein